MERIVIKNFGPLQTAEIDIRDINLFIGTTSSGKSTAGKLIALFKWLVPQVPLAIGDFKALLANYNIDFRIHDDTEITYTSKFFMASLRNLKIEFEVFTKPPTLVSPIYIPAERLFFPAVSQAIFGLLVNNIALPKWIFDFGAQYEKARQEIKQFDISFLNAKYRYDQASDIVTLPGNIEIKLTQASSGLQSVIPLLLVVTHNTKHVRSKQTPLLLIEEPELSLYPSSQKDLIEFIVERVKRAQNQLILTTHSPYVLTTLDNMIQANNVAKQKTVPNQEIAKLVPETKWIDFDTTSCYFFDKGTCYSTLDEQSQSIGPSNIDNVSDILSETFDNLLKLKYPE